MNDPFFIRTLHDFSFTLAISFYLDMMRSTELVFIGLTDMAVVKLTGKAGTVLAVEIMTVIGGLMIGAKIEDTEEEETQGRDGVVLTGNKANMVGISSVFMY